MKKKSWKLPLILIAIPLVLALIVFGCQFFLDPHDNRIVEGVTIGGMDVGGMTRREALDALTESVRLHGILQPLSVRRVGASYELIAGERRLRAAIAAGLTEIPCIVMNMTDQESGMTALVENLQRQDLDYLEQAQGISFLMESFSLSQEQAAQKLGISQSAVANKLRLLRHSLPVQQRLRESGLTERHARALLKLPSEPDKLRAIETISRLEMTVAKTEQYIESLLESPAEKPQNTNVSAFLKRICQTLTKFQSAGIPAVSERRDTENQIVLTITIPK